MAQGGQGLPQSAFRRREQDSTKGIWRALQVIFWLVGAFIFMALLFWPSLGVLLFWNVLIPVAPALLVIATGFWRNVCPLATTNLLPRHLGISKQQIMPRKLQAWLSLLAVVALYTIVPLRHAVFNQSGLATAILLAGCVASGWLLGMFYDWKSGWCSSLCPVHPVEKFYGTNPSFTFVNAHCAACVNCTVPCPDSTPNISPAKTAKGWQHRAAAILVIGGLPGFIWGWFQVPDEINAQYSFYHLASLYALPVGGMLMTIVLYLAMRKLIRPGNEKKLTAVFAAAAVSTYYWFRIPALFGFGQFNNDGLLIDLTPYLQTPAILALKVATVSFFFWWLVWKKQTARSWTSRPVYAKLKSLSSRKWVLLFMFSRRHIQ